MKLYLEASNEKKTVGIGSSSSINFSVAEGNRKVGVFRFFMSHGGVKLVRVMPDKTEKPIELK